MLRDKLNEALKEAMRARDTAAVGAIRLILAKLKDVDIAARTEASREGVADDRILSMLQGMIKQRNEVDRALREGQPRRPGRQGKGRDRRHRALPAAADGRGRRSRPRCRGAWPRPAPSRQGHGRGDGGAEGQVCRPDGLRQGVGGGEEGAGGVSFAAIPLNPPWRADGCRAILGHGLSPGLPRRTARAPQPVRHRRPQGHAEAPLGRGVCRPLPFHNEKTPSFTVNDKKGFFHCFGCGAHGDAVGFVMKTEGLSFPEAVEKLAREVGLPVPRATPAERERAERAGDPAAGRRGGGALVPEAASPAGRPAGAGLSARPRPGRRARSTISAWASRPTRATGCWPR